MLGPLRPFRFLKRIRYLLLVALVAFLLMQLVPYRLTNPATRSEPKWDSARTAKLAVVACFDCHSNESKHHWYTQIAPISWLPVKDAREGRGKLNLSEWDSSQPKTDDVVEVVQEGSMPPAKYTWFGLHKDAKLTAQERADLAAGLRKTLGELDGGSGGKGPG